MHWSTLKCRSNRYIMLLMSLSRYRLDSWPLFLHGIKVHPHISLIIITTDVNYSTPLPILFKIYFYVLLSNKFHYQSRISPENQITKLKPQIWRFERCCLLVLHENNRARITPENIGTKFWTDSETIQV